ncbi:MAG: sulfatase-like hydrolase/transferase [Balneolales bacterium]
MKKVILNLLFIASFITILGVPGSTLANFNTGEDQPPNILIISVDNMGYGDFSVFNKESPIITPNIDRLASQGAKLTDFYTASPTCTASRAALLTGRIPQRNKLDYQLVGIPGNHGIGLPHSEIIIPQIVKESSVDYATGAFGKWNLGFAPGSRPTERGFDEFLGHASGNIDHFSHVYAGKHDLYHNTESINRHGEYSSNLWADSAIDFIQNNTKQSKPWFVYLPFDAPHHPGDRNINPGKPNIWKAPDSAFEPYGLSPDEEDPKKRFNAVVTAMDAAVGQVLNSLDSLNISENTFVFFFSDNGAFYPYINADIQSNIPFRGAGVTLWEGGIHIPAIVRWPGKVEANSEINTRLWTPDLFVAISKLSGGKLPQDRFIDGKNPLPALTGQNETSPHATLPFKYRDHSALIWGDYKIVREDPEDEWQLFNIEEDISESNNLASELPDLVQKLEIPFRHKMDEIENYLLREAERLDL